MNRVEERPIDGVKKDVNIWGCLAGPLLMAVWLVVPPYPVHQIGIIVRIICSVVCLVNLTGVVEELRDWHIERRFYL